MLEISKPKSPPPSKVSYSVSSQSLWKYVEVEVKQLTNGSEGTNEIDIVRLVDHGDREWPTRRSWLEEVL